MKWPCSSTDSHTKHLIAPKGPKHGTSLYHKVPFSTSWPTNRRPLFTLILAALFLSSSFIYTKRPYQCVLLTRPGIYCLKCPSFTKKTRPQFYECFDELPGFVEVVFEDGCVCHWPEVK